MNDSFDPKKPSLLETPVLPGKPLAPHKYRFMLIILILLVIGAIFAFCAFYCQNKTSVVQSSIPQTIPIISAATTSADNVPTEQTWKTYDNDKYGFTFQYPSNLEFFDYLDTTELGTIRAIRMIYVANDDNSFDVLDISTTSNPDNLSAKEYVQQEIAKEKKCDEDCGAFSSFTKENQIQSGDNTFYGIVGGFTGEIPGLDIYYLSHNGELFEFAISNFSGAEGEYSSEADVSKEMYQVLDTFKFTK